MSWVAQAPLRVGARVFVAVARIRLRPCLAAGRLVCSGAKRPVLIVEFHGGRIRAFDACGRRYSAAEAQARFPQALKLAQAEALAEVQAEAQAEGRAAARSPAADTEPDTEPKTDPEAGPKSGPKTGPAPARRD